VVKVPSHHKSCNSRFWFEHSRQVQRARQHRMRQLQQVQQLYQCFMTSVYRASFPQHCGTFGANALHCFSPSYRQKDQLQALKSTPECCATSSDWQKSHREHARAVILRHKRSSEAMGTYETSRISLVRYPPRGGHGRVAVISTPAWNQ
jgi:hypothetical protein